MLSFHPMLHLFYNQKFVPLDPLYPFFPHSKLPTRSNYQYVCCINEFIVFFVLDSTYKWTHMALVFLWFILLGISHKLLNLGCTAVHNIQYYPFNVCGICSDATSHSWQWKFVSLFFLSWPVVCYSLFILLSGRTRLWFHWLSLFFLCLLFHWLLFFVISFLLLPLFFLLSSFFSLLRWKLRPLTWDPYSSLR